MTAAAAATTRVAVAQFATGTDVDENLATCVRMIAAAAEHRPDVVVLPEFANHVAWYDSAEHAYEVAVALDGPFVAAIGRAVAAAGCVLQVNCTVRRDGGRVSGTNLVFDRSGGLVSASDKQVLMGNENRFLVRAGAPRPVVDLDGVGPVGPYACMEGVIFEVARSLALRGARLLLNSLNSFALDEASLHIPVRAAESKVFVAAANKIGPIVPVERLEEVAAALKVPASMLDGGGESQIVAPTGEVMAMASRDREEVVWADVDLDRAADKRRPDGTDVVSARRPAVYAAIAADPASAGVSDRPAGPAAVEAAAAVDAAAAASAIADGARLVVLPELTGTVDEMAAAVAGTDALVVGSVAEDGSHVGVVVGAGGVVHRQLQLHRIERHRWAERLGDELVVVDTAVGRLAVVVGDDAVFPEVCRLAAVQGAEVVAVPFAAQEAWETSLGLVERAAENRVNLVAATAPSERGTSLVVSLPADFTLWVPRERPFDGTINRPDVVRASVSDRVVRGTIHPAHAANKMLSHATDLVDGRPWQLVDALVT